MAFLQDVELLIGTGIVSTKLESKLEFALKPTSSFPTITCVHY